ncbi:MAG: class I SAM-dependent methyltransferase [Saprospiraceae bacterium]|nr:class I SAM-dependent methyltransferase [Saprospiraceae bacterium]
MEDRKKHWEKVYQTRESADSSWYQPTPKTALDYLNQFKIPLHAKIIDIGGGDSLLVDHLLDLGYKFITVLDISERAIERAKKRLGERGAAVQWIVADAADLHLTEQYDVWHDRAAFHFLTKEEEVTHYLEAAYRHIRPGGLLILGTFSEQGPTRCSGLDIKQYSESSMTARLAKYFDKIECKTVDHVTPAKTVQNFIFCSFRK